MDDATLVSRAVGGDRDAFAAIFDRYAGAVHDLCTAVLRDGEEASEATLDSFLRAARELVNLRDRSQLRLWLLAVARHEATARARRRGPEGIPDPHGTPPAVAAEVALAEDDGGGVGGNGFGEVDADDPRRLVWDPSQALSEPDRATLHLHLRHELEAESLGAVLGVRSTVAAAWAAHLRDRAEASVGALLLSRADSGADPASCPKLAEVLDGWDGRFSPAVRARVDRHAQRCDVCRARRTVLLDRLKAMASMPFLPPPAWLRREVLIRMELAVSPRPLPGWDEHGFPPGIAGPTRRPAPRRRRVVVVAVATAVVVVGGGFVLLRDDGGRRSTVTAAAPSASTSSLPTVPTTSRPPLTAALTVSTTAVPGTLIPPTSTTVAGPVVPVPAPSPVVDRDPPAVSFGADVASTYTFGCPYSRTEVSAVVSDQSAVVSVALFVRSPEGFEESVLMSPDGVGWRATMGEFARPGQAVFWVEAVDSEGNRARAGDQVIEVFACE